MLTLKEKSPLLENFSFEEDWTHNTASSWTVSPTHKGKVPSTRGLGRAEPATLLLAGQPAQHIANWAILVPHCYNDYEDAVKTASPAAVESMVMY